MKTDIEIAREATLLPINTIAAKLGIKEDLLEPYGKYIAKVPYTIADKEKIERSKLILVTAITPTKAGIGKTTVSVGLALGMNRIGKNAVIALREPSLGPCFGMKGGAAGGGYAQVIPMDKINLHFTGDFHAVTSANNMIAALLDNYVYQRRKEGPVFREILWKRVVDVNDRELRRITTSSTGPDADTMSRNTGFDITPASEIMAILCLSTDIEDLRRRIDNILLAYTVDGKPFTVKDLEIGGSIVALLKDAINPNLVQTTENTPAFIHGGPFANIAHGCNSVIATRAALSTGDYVITEAGFGADLGAEKFFDIKCRVSGLQPSLTVLVATLNGLKQHGGMAEGFANLDKHIQNLRGFGQTVLVCFNKYASDTAEEIAEVKAHCAALDVPFALNNAFAEGGKGAEELANLVVKTIDERPSEPLRFTYADDDTLEEKITAVATRIYGAAKVNFSEQAARQLKAATEGGYGKLPVCIAKTQYSFSQDPKATGVPTGFDFDIRDVVVNAGAGIVVAIAGDIIRMPGLPKSPQALRIDVVNGEIDGLS